MNNIKPPYYAVIFTAELTADQTGYKKMSDKLNAIAESQPGFLGIESVDGESEITMGSGPAQWVLCRGWAGQYQQSR